MKIRKCTNIFFICTLFSQIILGQNPQFDFPLHIGNRWQYSEAPGIYFESRTVKDTLMSNGIIYTKVVGGLWGNFLRKEGSKVFSFNTASGQESLEYDFSLIVGDTLIIQIAGTDTILTKVSSKGTTTIFGQRKNYITFFRERLHTTYKGWSMIVDGIGFVQYVGELLAYRLTGAIINGISYGEVLHVEGTDPNIPDIIFLLQNYPNPFNPVTKISFHLPHENKVVLKVYDLLGKEVATIVDGIKSSGLHEVIFEGKNLSSGIYFYQLKTGDFIQTKKLTLIR